MSETTLEVGLIEFLGEDEGVASESQQEQRFHDFCTQVDNILASYDDQFDAFSEMLQNSMDALLHRWQECLGRGDKFDNPKIFVTLNYNKNRISILDNGCGVNEDNFKDVMRPNRSIKRRFGHTTARGEKGAGVVFLQFGHDAFEFQTKCGDFQQSYLLSDGRAWFQATTQALQSHEPFGTKKFERANYRISKQISSHLDVLDRGSYTEIQFGPVCKISQLSDLFGNQKETSLNRLEYILRTRTAIGFILGEDEESEFVRSIKVQLKINTQDGKAFEKDIDIGFLYPHEIAKRARGVGRVTSLMTDPLPQSDLLHDDISERLISKYEAFKDFRLKNKYREQLNSFDLSGYFSYANNNTYYEQISKKFLFNTLEISEEDRDLEESLIQVNAGFQVAVKNYPNGRRQQFIQRGGSEQKSRTYVVLNFRKGYKPDYGRKNLAFEARGFVNDLCKSLMRFATTDSRRDCLAIARRDAVHGARDLREAKVVLERERVGISDLGLFVRSGEKIKRLPLSEDEVILMFFNYVKNNTLPGFSLYGLPGNTQIDSLFDYYLPNLEAEQWEYHPDTNPLGVIFRGENLEYRGHWLEFKLSSDKLVEDFQKSSGDRGKKYFSTVDVLVCSQVDDSVDTYSLIPVDSEQRASERLYYGVTHFLHCDSETNHVVQVICLETLRQQLS